MKNIDQIAYKQNIISELEKQDILSTEWKNSLVIGDVHFGIKSNSLQWYEQQEHFFKEQVIPIIENANEYNIDCVIFLGDVFDIRYSTNNYIGCKIKELFREINKSAKASNINVYILAGNHDYYSPIEELKDYNTYESVFGKEFLECNSNIIYTTNKPLYINKYNNSNIGLGQIALLPWYETANEEKCLNNLNYIYKYNNVFHKSEPIRSIYAHWDLEGSQFTSDIYNKLKDISIPVYSGHIHYIVTNEQMKLYNIGACCAFTFNDANQSRYVYIINEKENKYVKIENTITPKFITLKDEEIFNDNEEYYNNNYVEFIISECNKNTAKYKEQIANLKLKYPSSNIRVKIMSDSTLFSTCQGSIMNTNIEQYIDNNVPDNLKENLIIIKEEIKQSKNK